MVSQSVACLVLLSLLSPWTGNVSIFVSAFSPSTRQPTRRNHCQYRDLGRCFMDPAFVQDSTTTKDKIPQKQFDKNKQEFAVGQIVQVCKPGLKAHQVPSKGKGTFDGTLFVPDESLAYLSVPVGLRGVVTKVIDTHAISANFPIRVKFQANDDDDDETAKKINQEYKPPVSFVMHFLPTEVEIVSE